ncbi:hypothetical protein D3C81_1380590 [compost metagenome]
MAQSAQLDLPASRTRSRTADGNAGLALQGVGQGTVTLAYQFFVSDDDGGDGIVAALFHFTGIDRHGREGLFGADVRRQRQRKAAQ